MDRIEYRQIVINPRVINHLGKDLITTSDVAITELIKNSLDAKADSIGLHVFNNFAQIEKENDFNFEVPNEISTFLQEDKKLNSIFVIEDNGCGMNEKQLNKGFLEVGTDIKLQESQMTLGEKGIGRLATQRLGMSLLIETASAEDSFATITYIDWEKIGQSQNGGKVPSLKINKVTEKYTRLWIFDINLRDFIEIPEQLSLELGQELNLTITVF